MNKLEVGRPQMSLSLSNVATGVALLGMVFAAGCGEPPAEAPQELGELGLYMFENFDNEDPELLAAGTASLLTMLRDEDLSVDYKDRAVTMPILPASRLGGLSIPDGISEDVQVPVALGGLSKHKIDDLVVTIVEPNQLCIESSSTKWAQRSFLTDAACFADGSCDTLKVSQEVRKESPLAKVWLDQFKDYRRFTFEDEDGTEHKAIVARSWIAQQFFTDSGGGSWDQLFHLDVMIEDGGETRRWFSMWSSVDVGGLGDDFYSTQVRDGIDEAFTFGEEFVDGNIESCKLDRDTAKPERN